jgi:hypothetical protein
MVGGLGVNRPGSASAHRFQLRESPISSRATKTPLGLRVARSITHVTYGLARWSLREEGEGA